MVNLRSGLPAAALVGEIAEIDAVIGGSGGFGFAESGGVGPAVVPAVVKVSCTGLERGIPLRSRAAVETESWYGDAGSRGLVGTNSPPRITPPTNIPVTVPGTSTP